MAASKNTPLHIALIFFVMATIVAGAMAYSINNDNKEMRSQLAKAKEAEAIQSEAQKVAFDEVKALKKLIGLGENLEVGNKDKDPQGNSVPGPNSLLTAAYKEFKDYAGKEVTDFNNPGITYHDALVELSNQIKPIKTERAAEMVVNAGHTQTISTLRTKYDQDVTDANTKRDTALSAKKVAEDDLQTAKATHQQELSAVNAQLTQARNKIQSDDLLHKQEILEKDKRIVTLEQTNDRLQDKIKQVTRTSFERPDGMIQWVDNTSHLVWINLGSADRLTKRTNFSIYKQNNRGVGRDSRTENLTKGPEDLKGAIEVTRILGPHLAEARILDEDYYDPISAKDPIYTPIWSPNQTESFAFVGMIDLDDDGRSDRDLLHDLLASSNATIQVEIDDEGKRIGGVIDEKTKFLVVGAIPKLEELSDQKEIAAAKLINAERKKLKDECREQGVRVVTLNDVMAFIGYTPRQRVFRPGDNKPFALRNGSQSTATSQTVGDRSSSGQTSGVYSRSKNLRQPTSTGQTSGAFRGGY